MPIWRAVEVCAKHLPQRWRIAGLKRTARTAKSEKVRESLRVSRGGEVVDLILSELEGVFVSGFPCATLFVRSATIECFWSKAEDISDCPIISSGVSMLVEGVSLDSEMLVACSVCPLLSCRRRTRNSSKSDES